jgi:hypothetical protein
MFPEDDFETFELDQLAADREFEDLYDLDLDLDLRPESDPVIDKALEVLRAAGLAPTHEIDGDVDNDGRPTCSSFVYVTCARGCGPVAEECGGGLTDKSECEAPEGVESNCQRAVKALTEAGAFEASGWAS